MLYLNSLILGLVQALTEFIPVSSSGHLVILHDLLQTDISQNLAFDVALHLGTGFALLIFFRKEIWRYAKVLLYYCVKKENIDKHDLHIAINLIIAAIPAGVIGALFNDFIEERLRSPFVVVFTLILGALLFFAVEKFSKRSKELSVINYGQSVLIGFAQAIALIPGISRSGITMTAAMALNFKREEAARFSFLISLPVIFGAGLMKLFDFTAADFTVPQILTFSIGFLTSGVVGFIVIKYLLKFLQNHSLAVFGWYRIALAIILLIWLMR